jgi:hypothetical protein
MRQWFKDLDRILRGEATRLPALRSGLDIPIAGLCFILLILGMLYGLCMGCFGLVTRWGSSADGIRQAVASMVKVPALFLLTLVVTFPSLYVFNALVGSRLVLRSVARLLVAAMCVTITVLASFGTIVAFFSFTSTSYPFMQLLNVLVFAISGILGLVFLLQTLHRLTLAEMSEAPPLPEPPPNPQPEHERSPQPPPPAGALAPVEGTVLSSNVRTIFRIWIIVFALVGAQMSWVLRPFIGNPKLPFRFFRERSGNFFEAVFRAIHSLLVG